MCVYKFTHMCVCTHTQTELAEMSNEEKRMEKLWKWCLYCKISFKNKTEQIKKSVYTRGNESSDKE